ncbi:MAG: 8-amino-7-oxononanoate synthase [Candidatus Pseudobacter hemicellulosilyticus]|uniref:8-amino-7-oxononanoate synthase n=1 Tax=Candidatus Pseudobacter hemicellulosilyticus TaxID=3121375 RepID=A0AAJ5WRI7_9BACT|nr:MAG: 8-amino-7-oxononanoate synthase [Pseudobacter sp.]
MNESFLQKKLSERSAQMALRQLRQPEGLTDFCSNDYLGIIHEGLTEWYYLQALRRIDPEASGQEQGLLLDRHGSGGSRLLAGNYPLIEETENAIASFHEAPAGLLFNSGYDANLGLLSCVPQKGDTVLYDALSHASLRDGIRLSFAQAHAFRHNDLEQLREKLDRAAGTGTVFVVTESVFSMDGDQAPLTAMAALCAQYGACLVVDEAHATGVIGDRGEGLVQQLGLSGDCFARIHTFGKAAGCHGAIVLGSQTLKDYLVNFCRPFIYTTALPESSVRAISYAYSIFPEMTEERAQLQRLISLFQEASLRYEKLPSSTPIQVVIIPGNEAVKAVAEDLQQAGLDVRPILYPTVPKGLERLRIVLHAFNTEAELDKLILLLS